MAYSSKTGKIVGYSKTAYHDSFCRIDVVEIQLEQTDGGVVTARMPMKRTHQRWGWNSPDYTACVGDTVELGWDYEHFSGRIIEAKGEGEYIPEDLPVERRRSFNLEDQMASLQPDPNSAKEMWAAAMLQALHDIGNKED